MIHCAAQQAFDVCEKQDILMTLGIKPSSPNTGYGYINFEKSENLIKNVKQFTEKPTLENATKFVESGAYLWNAGIFIWSVKSILSSFSNNLPEMDELFKKGNHFWNTENEFDFINTHYEKAENISIDYGIMEKATNSFVLPVDFGWNDLGTWGSLYDKLEKDAQNNALIGGEVIFRNASNNMVKTTSHKKVVIQGLNDYIVIENEDVILICPKQQEQDIKQITLDVKKEFGTDFV